MSTDSPEKSREEILEDLKSYEPSPSATFEAKKRARLKGAGSIIVKPQLCGKYCDGCPHGPYAWLVTNGNWKYLGKVGNKGHTSNESSEAPKELNSVDWDNRPTIAYHELMIEQFDEVEVGDTIGWGTRDDRGFTAEGTVAEVSGDIIRTTNGAEFRLVDGQILKYDSRFADTVEGFVDDGNMTRDEADQMLVDSSKTVKRFKDNTKGSPQQRYQRIWSDLYDNTKLNGTDSAFVREYMSSLRTGEKPSVSADEALVAALNAREEWVDNKQMVAALDDAIEVLQSDSPRIVRD